MVDVFSVLLLVEKTREIRLKVRNSDSGKTVMAKSSSQAGLVKTESSWTQNSFPEHSDMRLQDLLLGFQRPMKTSWDGDIARP